MLTKAVYRAANTLRRMGFDWNEQGHPRVQEMKKTLEGLGGIQFQIELFPDGNWIAESSNIKGILTGGTNKEKINDTIKDAIFTYFEIPPQYCNDAILQGSEESLKLAQRVVYA